MNSASALEELLKAALDRVAAVVRDVAEKDGKVTEKRLEELFVDALKDEDMRQPVVRQAPAKLHDWPNVGAFDVKVGDAAFELKWWGSATPSRYQTLWDACKLANAVDEGSASAGYLISAGEARIWAIDDGFTRLFATGEHYSLTLCVPAANWWTSPANDQTTVTAGLRTTFVHRVEFELGGAPYEVYCSRVEPVGKRVFVPTYRSPKSWAPLSSAPEPSEPPNRGHRRTDAGTGDV